MIYPEYESCLIKYRNIQDHFFDVLMEKERLLTKLLPNATTYDKDKVQGTPSDNPLEDYIMECDEKQIDEQIEKYKGLIVDVEKLVRSKEKELRLSQDKFDKIYRMRYLDGYGINKIVKMMNYSRPQIYRYLKMIEKNRKI